MQSFSVFLMTLVLRIKNTEKAVKNAKMIYNRLRFFALETLQKKPVVNQEYRCTTCSILHLPEAAIRFARFRQMLFCRVF